MYSKCNIQKSTKRTHNTKRMQEIKLYDHCKAIEQLFEKIHHLFEMKIHRKLQIRELSQFDKWCQQKT